MKQVTKFIKKNLKALLALVCMFTTALVFGINTYAAGSGEFTDENFLTIFLSVVIFIAVLVAVVAVIAMLVAVTGGVAQKNIEEDD
ncbi:hypothetical protein SAMN05216249_11061 [Acetitomaculum ruminis DSM 5522]|uniref:Uncharacterized protein n=1 Tax=Acetitomaculum ruminis DSM 5522 TaxID=1120918 RepID=A0A1I0YMW0_9FIRM|nr:hypothetical protein [Acetitomaculum ruminis]SFB13463.1 hypothetical protein SAMN05216249_11061 [Acetitomaculum ruminis DSM 5522]